MRLELVRAGEQMTQKELDFIFSVVGIIAQSGYNGPYELVGSRSLNPSHWISCPCFYNRLHDQKVSRATINLWFPRLNSLARELDLCHDQIPELIHHLPPRTPEKIHQMLADERFAKCLGADIDLMIMRKGIQDYYEDKPYPQGTGQIVDVFKSETGAITPFPIWPKPIRHRGQKTKT